MESMTTIHPDPIDAAVRDLGAETSEVVRRFLATVAAGRGSDLAPLYAEDATADCTVPNWRFAVAGAGAIGKTYATWYADPAEFAELEVRPTPAGAVLTFLITWEEHGMPHAAHHCHTLDLAGDRITRDTVFCGGRWSAALMAEMEEVARGD